MTGRAAAGAVTGLWAGLVFIFWVVLLPRIRDGDFYEVGDPLVYLGGPVLGLAALVGALVGAALGIRDGRRLSDTARRAVLAAGLAAAAAIAALVSWGIG